jgi:hypothetical protein
MNAKHAIEEGQRSFVCEKLLGWKRGIHEEQSFADPSKTIKSERWISPNGMAERKLPPLTLDLIWECEEKLKERGDYQLLNRYAGILHDLLEDAVFNRELAQDSNCIPDVYGFEWIHASKEQRLAALVETLANRI